MDDSILRYYEAEMRYLREAGREFAQAHPDRARLLDIDRVGDRDPYVERLYEGFAFLTARLRQKLDDELPELTEGVVSMLWPHYLRMIPSLSVLELTPDAQSLKQTEIVEAGMAAQSGPIGATGVRCTYRTTQPVMLQPIRIAQAGPMAGPGGRSAIRIRFEIEGDARRDAVDLSKITLFLHADEPTAFAMHLALTRHVSEVRWRIPGHRDGASLALPGVRVVPAGFGVDERLWPRADAAFSGYQLLLEYFTFRQKFLFVTVEGLDMAALPPDADSFELELSLTQAYPSEHTFDARQLRLHCAPIVNLFDLDAEPVQVDHHDVEYRVVPASHHGRHVETYAVESVESYDHVTAERHPYLPFSSFRHRGGMLRHEAPDRYFHTRVRQGVSGLHDTWLVLGGHAWDVLDDLPGETLSLRVTGTNGMLPRKGLREAAISELAVPVPHVGSVRHLCPLTLPLYPPTDDRFQWRVLSHLAPNFLSLMDAEVLRGALALYDWTDDELNRRRLSGIRHVGQRLCEDLRGGALERGVAIEVTLDAHAFSGDGDVHLFGELLHTFFAAYAEVNLFTQLTVVSLPSGERIAWPRRKAGRSPL